jgi:hypothetical protein
MRYLSIPILVLLSISIFTIYPCKAAPVWTDDFDSGNYNGWTITNGHFDGVSGYCPNGIFTAVNHTLTCVGKGMIMHPSTVTTGTWSFDFLGMNVETFDVMLFCINTGGTNMDTALGIDFYYGGWDFDVVIGNEGTRYAGDTANMGSWTGWQHWDITRDSDGRICIYHNGTCVMDLPPTSSLLTSVTTSEYFWIAFGLITQFTFHGAIDNIVVSNTVDIQPPQLPFYKQTWFLATVGVVIVVAVVVTVFILRRKK